MRLKALDQIHISSVSANTLPPGREFEVSDAAADDLMKKNPGKFVQVQVRVDRRAEPAASPATEAKDAAAGQAAGASHDQAEAADADKVVGGKHHRPKHK